MYPECNHGISLRVWGERDDLQRFKNHFPDIAISKKSNAVGRLSAFYLLYDNATCNMEEGIQSLLSRLIDSALVYLLRNELDAWIVVTLYDFVLFNFDAELLHALAKLNISLSLENHS